MLTAGSSRGSSWPGRPPTSAASGPPTRRAMASTSSPTGQCRRSRVDDFHGVAVTYQTIAAGPETHASPPPAATTLLIADEPHHMGDHAAWGLRPAGFRRRPLPPAPFRHALPLRQRRDPLGRLRRRGLSRRLHLRLPRGAGRPGLPADHLPALRRRDGVGQRRPAPHRRLRPRPARGRVGAPAAHRAQPGGRLDGGGAARRRREAEEVRAGGHPDAGGLVIASDQEHARAIARGSADLRRAAGDRDERRARRQPTDRRVRRLRPPLAGLGADGLRGRRHPPAAGRRLRHRGPHRALLPPGRRPFHPGHPAARAGR